MNLNHLDLQVSDVGAARQWFETHFGLRCTFARDDKIAFLEDESGFSLGVSDLFGSPPPVYPPDFHIGFVLEEAAQVEAIYRRLQGAGVAMKHELSKGGPNLYFMCAGPDDISVEVRAPLGERA